ncbi:peptide ABC transporter permease [Marinicauda salina]|uniref:Peptide ABC transporter permease n=1 Tax=Marinicauda salina TaxID=2135793 RepID=A0A2U2BSB8_9PROT|nr:FtsX-like permease family protein [Marinicauda salina]PWE16905.1 peptide ABC transporter permease [Marinicauda salina]
MTGFPLFRLAWRSIANRRATALLTALTVAISVTLFLGVEKVRHGARTSFENTISGTDLIVGARSSPVNLLLYAVFHIGDATNAISWESYQAVANAPGVEWTVPISLGDSHRGFRVVGTDNRFFERYRYAGGREIGFAQGGEMDGLFEAVVGASVARELEYSAGEEIVVAHGGGEVSFVQHEANPFTIAGVLEPTGTPIDRSVFVSLEAIEAIHLEGPTGAGTHLHEDELHEDDLAVDQITAFFVGLETPTVALRLQRQINTYPGEPLQAIIPGVALTQLWSVVGAAERTLAVVAAFVVLAGLVSILSAILTSLNERRREMAILRALGARPRHIFALLVSEAAMLAFLGAAAGTGITYGALSLAAPILETRYGIILPALAPGAYDVAVVAGVTAAAALLGVFPAWRAYRNSLADGMTIRV